MEEKLICPICGEPTSVYMGNARKDRLCKKHGMMRKNGEVIECETCGALHESGQKCPNCTKNAPTPLESQSTCIVCGAPSLGKPQCLNCYKETISYIGSFMKDTPAHEFRDYYFNLQSAIFRMRTFDVVQTNCNKLIAIALADERYNEDTALTARVFADVKKIIESKTSKPAPAQPAIVEEIREKDKSRAAISTAQDGHIVKSDMEARIDDVLYTSYILHCYEKNIEEIPDCPRKSDWWIPICNGKGIYIEYWGMDTEEYIAKRKEKEALYRKYNIPYIGIEKDDPKKDTKGFTSWLRHEIARLAIEHYGFMPEWKR